MRPLLLILALAAALPLRADFTMECGDLRRTNCAVSATAMVAPLDIEWQSQTCLGVPNANPLILGGQVIGHDLYKVTSLDLGTGVQQWVWKSTALGEIYNTPAYDPSRGLLYFTTMEGQLGCLRLSDGQPQWSVTSPRAAGCGNYGAATYFQDDIIYCDGQATLRCLRASDRSEVWHRAFLSPQWGVTPAIDGGLLYTMGSNGELLCLDASTGAVQWRVQCGHHFDSAVMLDDTRLYVEDTDGLVLCRSRADGSSLWSFQTGSFANGNMALDGSSLFCGSDDRHIRSLDCATGHQNWSCAHAGNFARSAPFVCGGLVFSSGCTGEFYGDNEASGVNQWLLSHGSGNSFNDWAYSAGWLIGTNRDGMVFCFRSHCPNCTATASPTPDLRTATPTATLSTSPTDTLSPTPSVTPTATPSASATVTASASPSTTSTTSPTATPTISATVSATATSTASPSASPSATAVPTPVTDAPGGLDDPGQGCYTYPNPSHGRDVWAVYRVDGPCRVRVRVFQSAGEPAAKVEQRHESAGLKRCQLPSSRFAPGVYFYKVDIYGDDGRTRSVPLGKFVCNRD